MRFFLTGSAGFIGFHLALHLLKEGHVVHGFDAMTPYYDTALKDMRLYQLRAFDTYTHTTAALEDFEALSQAAKQAEPEVIVHLAAQAGVRYSLENPRAYVDSNLVGAFNLLEVAKDLKPKHLLLASTSSVYGANAKVPFEETDRTDEPMTLYAATKKSMEVMAHAYAHLWRTPTTVFRFFTVYGPYGRPDMALFKFVDAGLKGEAIDVYGEGRQARDFTYINDLIASILRLIDLAPSPDQAGRYPGDTLSPLGPYRIVNLGGGQPEGLLEFIDTVEASLGTPLKRNMLPMQKGDVPRTFSGTGLLKSMIGETPGTPLRQGVDAFVDWFRHTWKRGKNL